MTSVTGCRNTVRARRQSSPTTSALSLKALRQMPDRFAKVSRHGNLRRKVFGNYLIFYRVSDAAVEIIHILHGAMDYERILFPENGSED